jgi:O-antigen/teichoic acid export membrane protein
VALGLLLTPSLVRRRDRAGLAAMHSTVLRTVGICAAGSALYLLFLWVLRLHLIDVLYGGRYTAYSSLPVMLAGALPVAASATVTFGSALRALEQPKRVFWSYAIFCVSAALCGVPIAAWWGLTGALAGMLLSYGSLVCAMVFFYYRALRAGAQGQPWIRTQTGSH